MHPTLLMLIGGVPRQSSRLPTSLRETERLNFGTERIIKKIQELNTASRDIVLV